MQKAIIIFVLWAVYISNISGQQEKKINIEFHGFVKVDYFFDSRQTVDAREGHFLLFPSPADFDINGNDINANPGFNILAVQTRLNTSISGPEFLHAKSSAFIEAAFFGQSNADINGLRLRHAFVKLNWTDVELLMGQYWHPMFITAGYPGVYSFNTGSPFQPFSRNPQLRLSYGKKMKITGTLYGQRDFASRGPNGTSSEYLRNSGIPAMNLQFQLNYYPLIAGAGIDYKVLKPLLAYEGKKYESTITSLAYQAYVIIKAKSLSFKAQTTYGENLADLLMLGGIAEHFTQSEQLAFTAFKTLALWSEFTASHEHMEYGIFVGYSKNFGLSETLGGSVYSLGGNIEQLWRVSLRSAWKSGNAKLGVELERTTAQYGNIPQGKQQVITDNIEAISNYRLLVIAMYSF